MPLDAAVPTVQGIDTTAAPTIVVQLSAPIQPGRWTTLTAAVENTAGVEVVLRIDTGSLPCDVDGMRKLSLSRWSAVHDENRSTVAGKGDKSSISFNPSDPVIESISHVYEPIRSDLNAGRTL